MTNDPRKTDPDLAAEAPEDRPSAEDIVPGLADAVAEQEAEAAENAGTAEARIAELEAERDELKDRLLRALAETENVRRRADRDRKDAEAYGGTRLARDLLSVHDNFERALANADDGLRETHAGFLEGVELIQRELLSAFAKHRIERVLPERGERFDPHRHQAMFEAPVPGAEPGTVIEVMQVGFTIADRLLRPALVGVAKAAPKPSAPAGAETSEADPAADDGVTGPDDSGSGPA